MDNRTDVTEDLQSTPEHPSPKAPDSQQQQNASQLTAGPHNDPPQSKGADDTYSPPVPAASQQGSVWRSLRQTVNRYPVQFALSLVGVGLTAAILARRRAR